MTTRALKRLLGLPNLYVSLMKSIDFVNTLARAKMELAGDADSTRSAEFFVQLALRTFIQKLNNEAFNEFNELVN